MTHTQKGDPREIPLDAREKGYEPSDVSPRSVIYVSVALFLALGLVGALILVTFGVFREVQHRPATSALETRHLVPPPPRLETSSAGERASIEAEALGHLNGYAWADRSAERVRIPIEKAVRLLAEQGWPDQSTGARP